MGSRLLGGPSEESNVQMRRPSVEPQRAAAEFGLAGLGTFIPADARQPPQVGHALFIGRVGAARSRDDQRHTAPFTMECESAKSGHRENAAAGVSGPGPVGALCHGSTVAGDQPHAG